MTSVDDVVRRWNPGGYRRLQHPAPRRVHVGGVPGSERDALVTELTELTAPDGPDYVAAPGYPSDLPEPGTAAVALMVLDASAVLGRTELAELDRLAGDGADVVCALTGVERNPGWRAVRDRDLDLLHRHAPWLGRVVVLPVSVTAAAQARRVGGDVGRVLAVESGLGELHDVLVAAVDAGTGGRPARAAVLARTRSLIAAETAALRFADDAAELRAERSRLAAAAAAPAPHPSERRVVQRDRAVLLQEVAGRVRAATAELSALLDSGAASGEMPAHLAARTGPMRAEIAASVAARWGPAVVTAPDVDVEAEPPAPGRLLDDRVALVLGASAGAGLGRLLATSVVTLAPAWAAAVTVGCGAVGAWWLVRLRRQQTHRDRMRRWLGDELARFRAALDAWVRECAFEAEARAARDAAERGRTHAAELRDRIVDLDDAIRRSVGEQRARIAACERDLAALEARAEPIARPLRPTGRGGPRSGDPHPDIREA